MSKSQRTKGHNWEREVAAKFRDIYPTARRGYQSRGGTEEASDVEGTPFDIECKVGKRPNIAAALHQAATRDGGGGMPLAVTKRDRCRPIASLYLDDFLGLLRGLEAHGWTLPE